MDMTRINHRSIIGITQIPYKHTTQALTLITKPYSNLNPNPNHIPNPNPNGILELCPIM